MPPLRLRHRPSGGQLVFAVAAVLLLLQSAPLQAQHLSGTVRAGTRGLDVGVAVPVSSSMNARLDASFFSYGTNGSEVVDDVNVDWDADGSLVFGSALIDWHPFRNAFRFSVGAAYNGLEGSGAFSPNEDIEVGDDIYAASEIGSVAIDLSFASKVAPYLGIGFGNPLKGRLGLVFDIGAMYVGSPSIELDATGMLTPTEAEAVQIEENLSWIQWYPVVSLGFSARLF